MITLNIYISSYTYVQFYSHTSRHTYPLRQKDRLTLEKNYAQTNSFKCSFFNRIQCRHMEFASIYN